MKTAIVTGCAGGIGFATVKKLTGAGIKVLGMDICSEADVREKFMDFGGCFKYFSEISPTAETAKLSLPRLLPSSEK